MDNATGVVQEAVNDAVREAVHGAVSEVPTSMSYQTLQLCEGKSHTHQ